MIVFWVILISILIIKWFSILVETEYKINTLKDRLKINETWDILSNNKL